PRRSWLRSVGGRPVDVQCPPSAGSCLPRLRVKLAGEKDPIGIVVERGKADRRAEDSKFLPADAPDRDLDAVASLERHVEVLVEESLGDHLQGVPRGTRTQSFSNSTSAESPPAFQSSRAKSSVTVLSGRARSRARRISAVSVNKALPCKVRAPRP